MRVIGVGAAVVAAALFVGGCGRGVAGVAPDGTPSLPPAFLSGTVASKYTGAKLARAVVQVREGEAAGRDATTDANGWYTFGEFPRGPVTVFVWAPGHRLLIAKTTIEGTTGWHFLMEPQS